MAICPGRKATGLLMVGVLLSGCLTPPGIRHCHSLAIEGAAHHHHETGHGTHGHHHHAEDGHHLHRELPGLGGGGSRLWHLHVCVLGFPLTFPDSLPDRDDQTAKDQVVFVVLRLGEQLLPGELRSLVVAAAAASPLANAALDDAALRQIVKPPPAPVSHKPLCDRARRERSGVLLA